MTSGEIIQKLVEARRLAREGVPTDATQAALLAALKSSWEGRK